MSEFSIARSHDGVVLNIVAKMANRHGLIAGATGTGKTVTLRKMAESAPVHFYPTVFQAFVKSLGIYPIVSLVRLESGRLGVVVEQSEKSLLTPRVKVFFSTRANARIRTDVVDLSAPGCRDKIAQREDPAQWQFPDLNTLWTGLPGTPW